MKNNFKNITDNINMTNESLKFFLMICIDKEQLNFSVINTCVQLAKYKIITFTISACPTC